LHGAAKLEAEGGVTEFLRWSEQRHTHRQGSQACNDGGVVVVAKHILVPAAPKASCILAFLHHHDRNQVVWSKHSTLFEHLFGGVREKDTPTRASCGCNDEAVLVLVAKHSLCVEGLLHGCSIIAIRLLIADIQHFLSTYLAG
jgi:hypothetical protein